ncbi:DMT family transporter [Sphingobium aromaticiconvertens]|uniref:DMT family transporter n=1 Tax=Sphingobium aromaticiconvertens TaxID=365341 RepID=UPI00301A7278
MEISTTAPVGRKATLSGISCGAGAGALWGLVFLAPELARDFSPLELTIGRSVAYGAVSVILIAPYWQSLRQRLKASEWRSLAWLSLAGNILYYILLSTAVQTGGIAMTSLIIGFLPVAVTIMGSREAGAVSLRKLAPSLILCAAGAGCIGWQALALPSSGAVWTQIFGLLSAVGALISWTAYAVGNSRCLSRLDRISAHEWSLLTGMVTGAQSLVLIPITLWLGGMSHDGPAWIRFAVISMGIALLASIGGNALWNRVSRLLPLTLVGQMILFETLFALIYGLIWEGRMPTMLEAAAFGLVVASVLACIAAHGISAAKQSPVPDKTCLDAA